MLHTYQRRFQYCATECLKIKIKHRRIGLEEKKTSEMNLYSVSEKVGHFKVEHTKVVIFTFKRCSKLTGLLRGKVHVRDTTSKAMGPSSEPRPGAVAPFTIDIDESRLYYACRCAVKFFIQSFFLVLLSVDRGARVVQGTPTIENRSPRL